MKKLRDVADTDVVKNTKFNITKENSWCNYIIHIIQYNINKQNLEKKIGNVDKKILDTSSLVTTNDLNKKICEIENKIPNTSNFVTTNVLKAKINEV